MKIAYVAAGAAGMYCGSCLHDNTLARALLRRGEEVVLVPTYTPLRTDEQDVSLRRLFFGGINVYLQQKSALFRHTPWFLDRLLDSPKIVGWLAGRSVSIRAEELGELTVSMLAGEAGRQRKEIDKLAHWLDRHVRPDVVHLSNCMLLGMAGPLCRKLGVPVVCSLSGEDIFLEKLAQPHYDRARELLKQHAAEAQAFVALNRYFAGFMREYLAIDGERIHVVRHGLDLTGHGTRRRAGDDPTVTIGYLARVCPEKGLHQLVEAFGILSDDKDLPPLRLRAAGYIDAANRSYLEQQRRRLAGLGLSERFEYLGEVDRAGKIAALQSFDIMSVPAVYHESKGISIYEALANAVPVVLPAHGAYPEIVEDTGGGILCKPDDPAALAEALRQLILDPARAEELGRCGQRAIRDRYTDDVMALNTLDFYRRIVSGDRTAAAAAPPQPRDSSPQPSAASLENKQ